MYKPDNSSLPMEVKMNKRKPKYNKIVFIPDIHPPFHDMKAIGACISFIRTWKPNEIIFLGDAVDFYAISRFNKDPKRSLELQDELDAAYGILKMFCRAAPNAKKTLLKGNHEHRLQKYLWAKAPELAYLRSNTVEEQLHLKELGIEYVESGKTMRNRTIIKHGNVVRKFAGYTARGEFEACGISGVSGHSHRISNYYHTHEGGMFVWMECGCLCDLNPEYMEGKVANWQQGFGIGYYKNSGSSRFNLGIIPIIKGTAMWGGMEFFSK